MTDRPVFQDRLRTIIPCLALGAAYVVFSALFIVIFKRHTHYRLMVIPLHLGLVSAWIAAAYLLSGAVINVPRFRAWRMAPYAISFFFAIPWTILLALYTIDYTANASWGANVTARILWGYVHEWRALFNSLPFPVYWVYIPLAAAVGLIGGIHIAIAKPVMRGFEALFVPRYRYSLFGNSRRAVVTLLLASVLTVAYGGFLWRSLSWRGEFWHGEPLVALFKARPAFADTPHRAAIMREAQQTRAQYPRNVSFDKKNVIIIMADSLRAAHMQVYGYERQTTPFLASLVESGHLRKVNLMMSTCSETGCGMLTTLSSRQYANLASYNFKIYDLLQECGYATYFIAAGDHTDFRGDRDAFGRNLDLFFDGKSSQRHSMNDDELLFEGLERVPAYSGRPAFFFLFLFSVHQVGVKHEQYARFQPAKLEGRDPWAMLEGNANKEVLTNHYDNGVLQYDAYVERLFATLREKGYLENSIVLFLADHGEGLGEHSHFIHCYYLNEEDIHIPLLIYDDPAVQYGNLAFADQIDVAPTIVDRLGLPIPACWEGHSLLNADIKPYSYHVTTGGSVCRAVVYHTGDDIYKFIRTWNHKTSVWEEQLYALHRDPFERENILHEAPPGLLEGLRQKAEAYEESLHHE